jgi:hypothetical protein
VQTESTTIEDDAPTPWETVTPQEDVYYEPLADPVGEEMAEPAAAPPASGASPALPPPPLSWSSPQSQKSSGGAFTIPLICLGVGVIAMCLLIPAADEVRKLAYERDRLKADLEQLQKQVATNDAFLHRVANDPVLAERLARRQLKMVPEGTAVLDLKSAQTTTPAQDMSPFLLVTVPPPAPMPPYRPVGGVLAAACRHPKTQLYFIGASLMAIASGLVLSRSSPATSAEASDAAGESDV